AGDALVAQALHIGAVGLVGALHLIAQIVQHLCDAAHADAANADEMHDADCLRHLHARILPLNAATDWPDAIASVRSASNRVASGRPADLAAAAIAARRSGASSRAPTSPAIFCGVSVDWAWTSAPPAAASAAALAAWSWSSACG